MTVLAVRMWMPERDAAALADLSFRLPADVVDRLSDQLWLRTVLVEQRRRTMLSERAAFDRRADAILEALDPGP